MWVSLFWGGPDEVEAPRAGGKGGAGKAPGVTVADLTVEMGTGGAHMPMRMNVMITYSLTYSA